MTQFPTSVASCVGCGACCRVTPIPPFEPGEAHRRGVPAAWLEPIARRLAAGEQFQVAPCVWFDPPSGLCAHYDHRPTACRDFLLGGPDCLRVRRQCQYPNS